MHCIITDYDLRGKHYFTEKSWGGGGKKGENGEKPTF